MDADIRESFASLFGQLSDIAKDARSASEAATETRRELGMLNGRVQRLEKEVFGSDPPPPVKPAVPLVARTSTAEADVDAIQGELLAVRAEVAKVKAMNEKQSHVMGIATAGEGEREPSLTDRALVFVRSRAGRELLVSIVLVILSAIGARAATSTAEKVERRDVPANVQGGR